MAFTINTNIASLQAQDYLNQTQTFQNQTINEVTSGLRIVNSGDDPSGLAIANSYRSNEAVLTQGVRNANDGLPPSTIQPYQQRRWDSRHHAQPGNKLVLHDTGCKNWFREVRDYRSCAVG